MRQRYVDNYKLPDTATTEPRTAQGSYVQAPIADLSASARSARSQEKSGSSRPK
jgi:hypothetical protein